MGMAAEGKVAEGTAAVGMGKAGQMDKDKAGDMVAGKGIPVLHSLRHSSPFLFLLRKFQSQI